MSLVTPIPQNTTIKAYRGVPWDNTLQDVRLFDNAAQRDAFLQGLLLGQWNNCSVVSVGKAIRVQAYYNNCLECNYLSFVNTQEGTPARTIYCYVTSVNYINVNTVEFVYEVDWIQTYLFDFQFESTLVEREHVNDDTQGKWILEEGIEFGEYQVDNQKNYDFEPAVVINSTSENIAARVMDNMYIPGVTHVYKLSDPLAIDQLNNFLGSYNNVPERITSIFMGVEDMWTIGITSTFFYKSFEMDEELTFKQVAGVATPGDYTPHNNRMLCYPYKLVTADNFNGSVSQYRWELFNTVGDGEFMIIGSALPKPCMQLFPINYRKVQATSTQTNTYSQEGITFDNFPALNYATDTFKAWVSQYGSSFVVEKGASVVAQVVGMAASIGMGNVPGAVISATGLASTLASAAQEVKDHQIHSQQSHGNISGSGLHYANFEIGFRLTGYSISIEDAKRIDNYFTRYGYRVEQVKVPNIRGRQYVNFVKCARGRVAGNIAVDAKIQMERALEQGVSFWHVNNIGGDLTSNPIVATS